MLDYQRPAKFPRESWRADVLESLCHLVV